MWNKIQQVSEKRDKLIAKKEIIKTLIENPDIQEEELPRNGVAKSSFVEPAADKYSILQHPNKSLIVPLPIELIITRTIQSPAFQQPEESQCEKSSLTLEEANLGTKSAECSSESLNSPSELRLQISNVQSSNSVSYKFTQDHLQSSEHQHPGPSRNELVPIKITDNQHLSKSQDSTNKTEISPSLRLLPENLRGELRGNNQNVVLPSSQTTSADCVPEKCRVSETCVGQNKVDNKTLNLTDIPVGDTNLLSGKSDLLAKNKVSTSRHIKSHLTYKSVLQYKKPLSR